jgi:hypothetical protein
VKVRFGSPYFPLLMRRVSFTLDAPRMAKTMHAKTTSLTMIQGGHRDVVEDLRGLHARRLHLVVAPLQHLHALRHGRLGLVGRAREHREQRVRARDVDAERVGGALDGFQRLLARVGSQRKVVLRNGSESVALNEGFYTHVGQRQSPHGDLATITKGRLCVQLIACTSAKARCKGSSASHMITRKALVQVQGSSSVVYVKIALLERVS